MMFPDLDHTGPMGLGRTPTTLRGVYANLSKLQSRMAEHQQKREQRMRDQQVREEKRREEQRKAEKRREDAEKRRDGKRRRDEATASNGEHPSRVQREHAVLSQVGARIRDIPEKLAAKHKSWYTTSPQPSQHSPQTADATPGTSQSPETKSNFIVHGSRQVPRPESVVMLLESMGSGGGSNGGGGSGGADGSSQPRQSSAPIAASHTQPRQSPAPIAASHTLPSMPGEYLAQFSSATGASPLSHSAAPSATTSPVPTPGWDEIMASCTVLSGHTTPLGIPGSRTSTASIDHTMLTFEAEKQKILAQLADIFNRQNFLLVASRALMAFGAPLHRLEANLIAVALNLDVQASFAALPGIILITFGDEDTRTSETYVVRSVSGYDMYRLGRTNRTIRRVLKGRITVGQGVKNIERVLATPPLYSWWILLIDYVVVSFCICPLFWNGSWRDAGVSAMLGLLIGVLQLMAGRFHNYANLFEVSSAFLVSFVAALMQGYVCFATVSFSGIAMLLPGLALTTSIIEMASRNMISGTVRLVFALCRCFMLGYGISVGSTLGTRVLGYASSVNLIEGQIGSDASVGLCLPGPSKFWWFLFLPMVSLGFNVSISAHWRQWPFMLIAGCLAYTVSYFASLSEALRPLAPAIAAFAMGLFANILASFYNHRSAVEPILGGVQLLVPGSLGLKTVLAFITSSDTGSGSFLYNMFATSLSIAVGLFLSGMVIFPNRKKRVGLMTF
ncbi:pheromone-regulated protein prm10 [Coemansia biformis]|uniref:Pheromone-regulated protein prm10 n=1 Tax=Coemansia biformis TaxID=1286918 RepID=A0A9W7Y8H6_9FUNG|nr:pheromone-regulated protein prm10 [Coemansia biformis]